MRDFVLIVFIEFLLTIIYPKLQSKLIQYFCLQGITPRTPPFGLSQCTNISYFKSNNLLEDIWEITLWHFGPTKSRMLLYPLYFISGMHYISCIIETKLKKTTFIGLKKRLHDLVHNFRSKRQISSSHNYFVRESTNLKISSRFTLLKNKCSKSFCFFFKSITFNNSTVAYLNSCKLCIPQRRDRKSQYRDGL